MRKADLVAAISDGGYPGTGKSGPRRDGGLALHTSGEGDDTRPQRTRRRRDNGSTDPESRSSEGERTPSVGDLLDAAEVQKRADKVPTQEDGVSVARTAPTTVRTVTMATVAAEETRRVVGLATPPVRIPTAIPATMSTTRLVPGWRHCPAGRMASAPN